MDVVSAMQELLAAEVHLQSLTNPWADEDLRNGWDTAGEVTAGVGIAALVVGALLRSVQDGGKRALMGGGGGRALLGGLAKIALGEERGDKIRAKIAFLEMSRRGLDRRRSKELRRERGA